MSTPSALRPGGQQQKQAITLFSQPTGTVGLQGLAGQPSALPPVGATPTPHLTTGSAQAVDLGLLDKAVQDYATDPKQSVGWFFSKMRNARKLAIEYLTAKFGRDNPALLNQILKALPWYSSRGLSVLCVLVEKGLGAAEITDLLNNQKQIERGEIEFKLGRPLASVDLVLFRQFRTSTFLKKVAEALPCATAEGPAGGPPPDPVVFPPPHPSLLPPPRPRGAQPPVGPTPGGRPPPVPSVGPGRPIPPGAPLEVLIENVLLQPINSPEGSGAVRQLLDMPLPQLEEIMHGRNLQEAIDICRELERVVFYGDRAQKNAAADKLLALQLLDGRRTPEVQAAVIKARSRLAAENRILDWQKQLAATDSLLDLVKGPQFHAQRPEVQIAIVDALNEVAARGAPEAGRHKAAAKVLTDLLQATPPLQPQVQTAVMNAVSNVAIYSRSEKAKLAATNALLQLVDPRLFETPGEDDRKIAVLKCLWSIIVSDKGAGRQQAVMKLLSLPLPRAFASFQKDEGRTQILETLKVALEAGLPQAPTNDSDLLTSLLIRGGLVRDPGPQAALGSELKQRVVAMLLSPEIAPSLVKTRGVFGVVLVELPGLIEASVPPARGAEILDRLLHLMDQSGLASSPNTTDQLLVFDVFAIAMASPARRSAIEARLAQLANQPNFDIFLAKLAHQVRRGRRLSYIVSPKFVEIVIEAGLALLKSSAAAGSRNLKVLAAMRETLGCLEQHVLPESRKPEVHGISALWPPLPPPPPPQAPGPLPNPAEIAQTASTVFLYNLDDIGDETWQRDVDILLAAVRHPQFGTLAPEVQIAVINAVGRVARDIDAWELIKKRAATDALLALPLDAIVSRDQNIAIALINAIGGAAQSLYPTPIEHSAGARLLDLARQQAFLPWPPELQTAFFHNLYQLALIEPELPSREAVARTLLALPMDQLFAPPATSVQREIVRALEAALLHMSPDLSLELVQKLLAPPLGPVFADTMDYFIDTATGRVYPGMNPLEVVISFIANKCPDERKPEIARLLCDLMNQKHLFDLDDNPSKQLAAFEALTLALKCGDAELRQFALASLQRLPSCQNFNLCLAKISQRIRGDTFLGGEGLFAAGLLALPLPALAAAAPVPGQEPSLRSTVFKALRTVLRHGMPEQQLAAVQLFQQIPLINDEERAVVSRKIAEALRAVASRGTPAQIAEAQAMLGGGQPPPAGAPGRGGPADAAAGRR